METIRIFDYINLILKFEYIKWKVNKPWGFILIKYHREACLSPWGLHTVVKLQLIHWRYCVPCEGVTTIYWTPYFTLVQYLIEKILFENRTNIFCWYPREKPQTFTLFNTKRWGYLFILNLLLILRHSHKVVSYLLKPRYHWNEYFLQFLSNNYNKILLSTRT